MTSPNIIVIILSLFRTVVIMPLSTRKIGKDDVSEIGFGAMGLSAFYGPVDTDEERFKVWNSFWYPNLVTDFYRC